MAIVKKLEPLKLEKDAKHLEVNCTFSIITDDQGKRYLQIDTYGSAKRRIPGKKSQSLRFTPEAIEQLKDILDRYF
jgi:hypothetical protein